MLCMAERVGFEPTHALRRLVDFESTPLDLLGTFPYVNTCVLWRQEVLYHIRPHKCKTILLSDGVDGETAQNQIKSNMNRGMHRCPTSFTLILI